MGSKQRVRATARGPVSRQVVDRFACPVPPEWQAEQAKLEKEWAEPDWDLAREEWEWEQTGREW